METEQEAGGLRDPGALSAPEVCEGAVEGAGGIHIVLLMEVFVPQHFHARHARLEPRHGLMVRPHGPAPPTQWLPRPATPPTGNAPTAEVTASRYRNLLVCRQARTGPERATRQSSPCFASPQARNARKTAHSI